MTAQQTLCMSEPAPHLRTGDSGVATWALFSATFGYAAYRWGSYLARRNEQIPFSAGSVV